MQIWYVKIIPLNHRCPTLILCQFITCLADFQLCRDVETDENSLCSTTDGRKGLWGSGFLDSDDKIHSLENGPSVRVGAGLLDSNQRVLSPENRPPVQGYPQGFFFTRRRKYECRFDGLKIGEVSNKK